MVYTILVNTIYTQPDPYHRVDELLEVRTVRY